MLFEQHYLNCLSQACYVIADESTKRAVVVDPRRNVSPYLETAEEHRLTIELVLETHFHADFLSGHLELAAATGAEIGYGDVAVTADELAGQLYDSLHEQLLTLPDATRVFPAHGAGSACGKNLSTDTSSTIGEQRAGNYALQPMSKDDFVLAVTEGQPTAPAYFAFDAMLNRENRALLDEHAEPVSLSVEEIARWQRRGAAVVDTRDPVEFARGHLIGSINIGMAGRYAEFAGGVVQPGAPIVIVAEEGQQREAKNRLARIGFDNVVGCLRDAEQAFLDNLDEVTRSSRLDVAALRDAMASTPELQLVDVRGPGEAEGGMIEGAILAPLPQLNSMVASLDASKPTIVYCAGGYRSSIGASRLVSAGFADVSDLLGGHGAWTVAHAAPPA